jgi:aspartyl/asparaginyl-tRNA synthetase
MGAKLPQQPVHRPQRRLYQQQLQVVAELGAYDEDLLKKITPGASLKVTGRLVASLGKGQAVEVKATTIEILGECNPDTYPLQLKNRPSLEYLREIAHLRFRTNTFGAIFRVRHALLLRHINSLTKEGSSISIRPSSPPLMPKAPEKCSA